MQNVIIPVSEMSIVHWPFDTCSATRTELLFRFSSIAEISVSID